MVQKKHHSYALYLILLAIFLLAAYVIGGLFQFDDLSLSNFSEKLEYIIMHPLHFWWSDKTPGCFCAALIGWAMALCYIQYALRNFQPGMEYGSEEWADPAEINQRRFDSEHPERNKILSENLRISLYNQDKQLRNNNMLIIGASGSYKTNSIVTPNILRCDCNYAILDVKGELLAKYGNYMKRNGYTIRSLNLVDMGKSDRYNPFRYIETEKDIITVITNITESCFPPEKRSSDPFWEKGPRLYLHALFFYEWITAKEEHRQASMNNILALANLQLEQATEEDWIREKTSTNINRVKGWSKLQLKMEATLLRMPQLYPAVRDYRKVIGAAEDTMKSLIVIVNSMLETFELPEVQRIFSGDDLNLREFATGVGGTIENPSDKKIALFLNIPDDDESFNFIVSILYTQMFYLLERIADNDFRDRGAKLPIPLEFWMDEFYAGARPTNTLRLLGVLRSRNISVNIILQSLNQLKDIYPQDKWLIPFDNCSVVCFLGSGAGALDTQKYISDLLDSMTIDMATDGKNGSNGSTNFSKLGRKLATPAEVRRMDAKNLLLFMDDEYPVIDRKALPWEMPEEIVPYETALNCNKEEGHMYIHPVKAVWIEEKREWHTIREEQNSPIRIPTEQDEKELATVILDEEAFIRMNLSPEKCKKRETAKTQRRLKQVQAGEQFDEESLPEDVKNLREREKLEKLRPENRDISGSVTECLARHFQDLSADEKEIILSAIEANLPEEQIKELFLHSIDDMRFIKRLYVAYQQNSQNA